MQTVERIQEAVRHLAGVCDGAQSYDGCGFNKMDSSFGKSLAQQERWSSKQAEAGLKLIRKYRNQLLQAGFEAELFETELVAVEIPKRTTPQQLKKASLAGERIKIQFPFAHETLAIVKSIPGRKFHGDGFPKFWSAPLSVEAVRTLQENGFELEEALNSFLSRAEVSVDDVAEITPNGLKKELFAFQKKGVAFIEAKNGRALVGDEMGLGKTIQALAWLQLHPKKRPAIILCPAHLKLNWAKETRETLSGDPKIQILQGTKPYPITGEIIIINYDILGKWLEKLQTIKAQVLVFDEAHYIKNSTAQRTKATKKLAKNIPHVIALSGTPIVNRPVEGFNIVQILDKTVFPNFWQFAHKYCGAKHNGFGWDFTGATNKEELHKILAGTIMIRRKKADVLPDLPDKLYSYIPMEISNRNEYEAAETNFINYLRQIKGDGAAKKASQAEHLVKIEALKQLTVKGKMEQAINWIQNFITTGNGDSKLVVFTVHKVVIDALMDEFKSIAVKVDGSCSAEQRHAAVEKFQNDPDTKLFVGNIQAAGTGLTLTAASSVAFLELPWTPGELVQAEDRCHRIGQKDTVNVYYLLAEGTIEEKIAELLDEKRQVLEAVLDGNEVEETQMLTKLIETYQKEKK
jgi:SWI/SNF-related matrix-associated actin-dependent regulator 1 of chromatin subfamily A